jgi:hypothetical protein
LSSYEKYWWFEAITIGDTKQFGVNAGSIGLSFLD